MCTQCSVSNYTTNLNQKQTSRVLFNGYINISVCHYLALYHSWAQLFIARNSCMHSSLECLTYSQDSNHSIHVEEDRKSLETTNRSTAILSKLTTGWPFDLCVTFDPTNVLHFCQGLFWVFRNRSIFQGKLLSGWASHDFWPNECITLGSKIQIW